MQVIFKTAAIMLALAIHAIPAEARIKRSQSAKVEFKLQHPCPATGARKGPCKGYEIDHRIPLKCHGADTPANMQWLSVQDHKAKTKREARLCRG